MKEIIHVLTNYLDITELAEFKTTLKKISKEDEHCFEKTLHFNMYKRHRVLAVNSCWLAYILIFKLNSAETKISMAHKCCNKNIM